MNRIKKIINSFLYAGIDDTHNIQERLKIQTSNEVILMVLCLVVVKETINIITFRPFIQHIAILLWGIIFYSAHILAKRKKHEVARVIIISIVVLLITFLQISMGHEVICIEPVYAVLIYFIILYYRRKIQNVVIPVLCLLYVGLTYVNTIYPPPFAKEIPISSQLLHVSSLFIFFFLIVRKNILLNTKNHVFLRKQQLELEDKNKQLNQFNYIISHDLKEPVRSMVSFAYLLKRNKGNKAKQKEFTNFITRSGYQLDHLINGIKEYQELTSMKLVFEKVELNELFHKIQHDFQTQASIKVENFPAINTAKQPLLTVFRNLVKNGIRFNKNEKPQIYIWSEIRDEQIHLYFKDNGMGIEKEYHETIFEMFKRLGTDNTKSPGLGLNLCRRIIEKLDGTLKIDASIMGKGSTFCISLPYQNEIEFLEKQNQLAFNV